jgi:hypothetical protein
MISEQEIARIHNLMKEYFFYDTGFKVTADGKVDVVGNIEMKDSLDNQMPVQFGLIAGNLNISYCALKSLAGCGDQITGVLNASNNLIRDLVGAPEQVGSIILNGNRLTNLQGAPQQVRDTMRLMDTDLHSLEGLPTQAGAVHKIVITYAEHLPMLRLLVADQVVVKKSGGGYSRLESEQPLQNILNDERWAGKGKSHMLQCANELKKAGYVANAAW